MDDDDFFLPPSITEPKNERTEDITVDSKVSNEDEVSSGPSTTSTSSFKQGKLNEVDLKLSIKRILRKGKVFQIRKMTRKINMLRKKRGTEKELEKNERKVIRILKEIEEIKNIDIENLSKIIEDMTSSGDNKFCDGPFEGIKMNAESIKAMLKIDENVLNVFLNCKSVKPKLLALRQQQQAINVNGSMKKSNFEKQIESKGNEMACLPTNEVSEMFPAGVRQTLRGKKDKIKRPNENKNFARKNAVKDFKEIGKNSRDSRKERQISFDSKFNPKSKNFKNQNRKEKSLGEMRKKLDQKKIEKMKMKLKGGTGNRLGQRARRAMWEKLYGTQAEHVKMSSISNKRHKGDKKNKQLVRNKTLEKSKNELNQTVPVILQRKNEKSENLHPSWHAKRQQKKQAGIVEFQGTKMTFD